MFLFVIRLVLTSSLLFVCQAKALHVAPTLPADQTCPPPCYTLDHYAQNPSQFFGDINISLIFLVGVHNLKHNLSFSNYHTIEFKGLGALPKDTVINLIPSTLIYWLNIVDLHLYNVRVENDYTSITLPIGDTVDLNGLYTSNSNLHIQNCSLKSLVVLGERSGSDKCNATLYDTIIRSEIYISDVENVSLRNSQIIGLWYVGNIRNVLFLDCVLNASHGYEVGDPDIVGVIIHTTSEASIENMAVSDTNNVGLFFSSVNSVTITKSNFENNRVGIVSANSRVIMNDTVFMRNGFGVITLPVRITDINMNTIVAGSRLALSNCTFSHNINNGLVLASTQSGRVQITDCSFNSNQGTPITAYQSIFELRGETVFNNNTVKRGGGLALINSTVIFARKSSTIFENNTAEEFGGAIYIVNLLIASFTEIFTLTETDLFSSIVPQAVLGQSCFYSTGTDSYITFAGNKAIFGGYDVFGSTVYPKDCSLSNNPHLKFSNELSVTYLISSNPTRVCFCTNTVPQCDNRRYLVLNETRYPGERFSTSVVLAGYNYGRVAGSVYTNVLGGDYKQLINENQHLQTVNLTECSELIYSVSSISNQARDSVVLVLTTQERNTQPQNEDEIDANNRNIHTKRCLKKTPFPCTALLTTPVYINITLDACPLGFELDETTRACDCDSNLASFRDNDQAMITCTIQNRTGYIIREGTVWVGVDTIEDNADTYYFHRYCLKDYCNYFQTTIDLKSPDGQCSSNRAGVLCGRCQANYSLQLGGNKCLQCSDSYLALLIVFAVLGILLVATFKLLDLTVSSGTINGLIFYANVVWRNNAILFSLKDRQSIGFYITTLPIAWINLDFGIETCFSENLDQLTKTGLQFVFPVYIWCIAGLIIIISHYSTRATKLFGNNSVSVLATLFLLSYGKLFRNITDVFTFADLPDSNGTTHKVWSLDGNIRYGGTAGHIVLIVVALLFFTLFLLPFTLTLLLVPFLRAKSHLRPLHWINTLKPFFDTYYGPFKDHKQHQVWTGILLVSRVLILIVFASTSTYSPNANILLMMLVSLLLLMYSAMVGLLYQKWYLFFLENLYLLNLTVLGGTFLFYQLPYPAQENSQHIELNPVVATSVVIALLLFIFTVILYTTKRIISTDKAQRCLRLIRNVNKEDEVDLEEIVDLLPEVQEDGIGPTVQIVAINKNELEYDPTMLRETLLEM